MGWSSGTDLFEEVIHAVQREIPHEHTRYRLYYRLIQAFENQDWDGQDECIGADPMYDLALEAVQKGHAL